MTQIAMKFVQWDVPELEKLKDSKVYKLRERLDNGDKLSREEKNWLTRNVKECCHFKRGIALMGYRFDFSDVLKRYFVKQHGHIAEYYAIDKTALRSVLEDAVAQSGPVTADNGVVMQSDDQSDDQTGDQQSQDSMPDNPNAKLPGNVSDEISDDATVISEDLAATPEGEVKNIETGEIVTDPTLVGTQDQQPDPLAKTTANPSFR